ncbi:MFS transporter [Patescibacteria group bacterium]|nr:MFS transporter [Patescibacteria group bacterium]
MLKETFIGRNPSHFHVNPLVKSFIISETFVWSAWNFFAPIFAIFVATDIKGGNIQFAAFAFSFHLIVRVLAELASCKYLPEKKDHSKIKIAVFGLVLTSIAYIGFAFSKTVLPVLFFYSLVGAGIGIATPAKNSLFSTHLDKNKEPAEWGIYDAAVFIGMAFATALGGLVASQYGFQVLFLMASLMNIISIIPYLLYAE